MYIIRGGHTDCLFKELTKIGSVINTAFGGHLLYLRIAHIEKAHGQLDSLLDNIGRYCNAHFFFKAGGEIAGIDKILFG